MATIQPSLRSSLVTSAGTTQTDTVAINYPATIVAGDLLVCVGLWLSTNSSPNMSATGWAQYVKIGNTTSDAWGSIAWKVADGTESGSVNFTMPRGTHTSYSWGWMASIRDVNCWVGCSSSDVFGGANPNATSSASTAVYTRGVTTPQDAMLVLGVGAKRWGNAAWGTETLSGYTRHDSNNGGGSADGFSARFCTKGMPTAGSSGYVTWSGGTSAPNVEHGVSIYGKEVSRRIFIT